MNNGFRIKLLQLEIYQLLYKLGTLAEVFTIMVSVVDWKNVLNMESEQISQLEEIMAKISFFSNLASSYLI